MIHFYSGITKFGGSIFILDHVVRLLNAAGVPALFHGDFPWFEDLSPHNRADGFPELQPDDVLVAHFCAPERRPNVRRSVFALFEPSWDWRRGRFLCELCGGGFEARLRAHHHRAICRPCAKRSGDVVGLAAFDAVVFATEHHRQHLTASQAFAGDSAVIPFPVDIDFSWSPPSEAAAGVIGRIEGVQKQPHVSVREALKAGFSRVLLWGPIDDPAYFEAEIEPLLGGGVQYMGIAESRRQMYDSISAVFHFARYETGPLVSAECEQLGIPYYCAPHLQPWQTAPHADIVAAWRKVLQA